MVPRKVGGEGHLVVTSLAGRDHAVNVRMQQKVLAPGMEDADDTDLGADHRQRGYQEDSLGQPQVLFLGQARNVAVSVT